MKNIAGENIRVLHPYHRPAFDHRMGLPYSRSLRAGCPALGGEDATFRLNLLGTHIVGLMMARYVLEVEPLASLPQSRSRQRSHRRFSATWLDC